MNTEYRIQNTGRRAAWVAVSCILYSVLPAAADPGEVAHLRLRAQAVVAGDVVTLGDVLEFGQGTEQMGEQLAAEPVSRDPRARSLAAIPRDQIVKRLEELDVNLSRVLLGGALQCQIQHASKPAASNDPRTDLQSQISNLKSQVSAPPGTLAAALRTYVDQELAALGGAAEMSFERGGQEFLQLTTPPWEFQISSSDREKLGLREFHVLIRRDGQVQRKASVVAQVRLVRPVVVARHPLNPGNFVRSDDVALETRVFERDVGRQPTRVEEVVGQQIKRFVPQGELVAADALQAVELVVRSRPVMVTGDNAGIQVRLTGVALDSGGYGETVRVRLGDSRGERKMLRGVVTGLGAVRLAEGNLQ
jgi:flagella basal body P-ring formation protein FlgA